MAAKDIKKKISQEEAVTAEEEEQPEVIQEAATFKIGLLREHCKELFGVQPEIFDGAFYDVSGTFSKEEADKRIKLFLNKKVSE